MKNKIFILLATGLIVLGCSKDPVQPVNPTPDPNTPNTPGDTTSTNPGDTTTTPPVTDDKGILKAMPRGTDAAPYGYYVYTPEAYATDTLKYALLIYLHGSDETGDSQGSPAELDKVLGAGPPKMIDTKHWAPSHSMVVIAPQCHEGWWDREHVRTFIRFVSTTYRVDTTRIYLTGISMGGNATIDQLNSYDDNQIAAAVPMGSGGVMNDLFTQRMAAVPLWFFHGEEDQRVLPEYVMTVVPAINALSPDVRAKLTLYPGVGHECGEMTYTGSGMGKEDPSFTAFSMDIYTWMYQYTKPVKL
jgi:dienelactone hydrolase